MTRNARALLHVASVPVASVRPDERWRVGERGARLPGVAVAILAGSLVLHLAVLAFALLRPAPVAAAPAEIPVEIVQEVPPPEPPKAPPPPAETVSAPPPKAEGAPAPPPPTLRAAAAPDLEQTKRASLEQELAALEAEHAELQARHAQSEGTGPLRDSIRAVALPTDTEDAGADAVDYQSLVFSALAKAKEGIASKALAGTVGVRFSVDEAGRLVDVGVAVSSGNPGLDEEAVTIVRRAAPFPKPPAGAVRVFSANVSSTVATR